MSPIKTFVSKKTKELPDFKMSLRTNWNLCGPRKVLASSFLFDIKGVEIIVKGPKLRMFKLPTEVAGKIAYT